MDLEKNKDYTTSLILGGGLLFIYTAYSMFRSSKGNGNVMEDSDGKKISLKEAPSTMGWPIIGHLPYLDPANPYKSMNYYMMKFGKIFGMKWGSWNAVLVTDYHLIKKLYGNADYAFRPTIYVLKNYSQNNHGLTISFGSRWKEHRRFTIRQLRDLGVGKSSIESHVLKEIDLFCQVLKETKGKPCDPLVHINFATTNIIWAITTGQRLEYNDPKFVDFVHKMLIMIEVGAKFDLVAFVPWIHNVVPEWILGSKVMHQAFKDFHDYTMKLIEDHRKTFDPSDPRDFIDQFLIEQEKQKDDPNSTFSDIQLSATLVDFFVAGGETVAATLRWAVLLLAMHPQIQKKAQEEMRRVIGQDRFPLYSEKDKLPYTSAVINEIQRFADITTYGLFHANNKDTVFEGYHIPKDTIITAYFGNMHRSKEYWERPYEFYPEHFLTADGKLRENVDGFLPFSIGKRQCIGLNLARLELFDFITQMLYHFEIKMDESLPLPSLDADPKSSLLRWPNKYSVSFNERIN